MNNETNPTETANVEQVDLQKLADKLLPRLGTNLFCDARQKISQLTKRAEAAEAVKQRLTDLVRFCRIELNEAELITMEEYAELAGIKGSPARLESYDDILARLKSLEDRNKELVAALIAVKAHSVTHAVGCSHRSETCSCHKSLMEKALKVSTEGGGE